MCFCLNSPNCLNCTRICIPLVWTSLLVGPCPCMCEQHIHCFFLVVAASSNCIWDVYCNCCRHSVHYFTCIVFALQCNFKSEASGIGEIFFRMGFFKKNFSFRMDFFDYFFRLSIFGGVASMQKLVYFRFMRFSGRFRHSFTPFGANYGFPVLWTPFFSSKSRFFSEMPFFKNIFFSNGFFRLFFFRSEFFGGAVSKRKLVLFRFMGFSGRFRHSFTPFGANF